MQHCKNLWLIVILIFLNTRPSRACLNEYYITLNGEREEGWGNGSVPHGHDIKNIQELKNQLHHTDSMWHTTRELEWYSNYGVLPVYPGRYKEAKKVFTDIEKLKPGLYATAVNLGTVYELIGENERR